MAEKIENVVVVGGGTMGSGIAQLLIEKSIPVTLIELDSGRVEVARNAIAKGLRDKYSHSKVALSEAEISHSIATAMSYLASNVGIASLSKMIAPELVIETVVEDIAIKSMVLGEIEEGFPEAKVIASNTSSLSISALGATLSDPSKFLGMHFFNPVPRSSLVEIVLGPQTSDNVTSAVRDFVEKIGLESILVHDSPGFATSRLGVAIGLEAIRMLEEGVASAEDIDRGMVLGYKFPLGPLKLTDLVGLDVRLAISKYLESTLGPRFCPPKLLIDKVSRGELGKKSGRGFYDWP